MSSPPPLPKKTPKSFKTKIEGWMIAVAVKATESGLPLKLVGGLIGATSATVLRWRTQGEQEGCPDPLLVEFALAIEEARTKAALEGMRLMNDHAATDWKAALEVLRASDPETWSAQSRVKIDATVQAVAPRNLSALSDEELNQLASLENKLLLTSG